MYCKSPSDMSRGFTLIEMLVTIFVYGIVLAGATALLVTMFQQSTTRRNAITSIDQVRIVGAQFANEVRDAEPGNDGSFAIGLASTTQVIIYSAYGSANTSVVRRIRYYLSNGTLYKGIVSPSGSPPSYNLGSETVAPAINGVVSTSTIFSYFNGSYAGTSSPLTQPVNLTQVTFIQMNLSLTQPETRTSSTTYNFSAGSAIRSLKTNLGN